MHEQTRRYLGLVARVAVAVAGIALIVWSVHWHDRIGSDGIEPGLRSLLQAAEPGWLVWGGVCVGLVFPLQAVRWWLLMRCRGLRPTLWRCFALTMVGQFFNLCLPGLTGGDVARAWYAAKGTDQRATAAVSVLVDRAVGLLALAVLTAATGVWGWSGGGALHEPIVRTITLGTWGALACLAVAGGVYAWPMPRRAMGRMVGENVEKRRGRVARLLRSADAALVAYRGHPWALLSSLSISVVAQLLGIASLVLALRALGVQTPLTTLLVVLPLVLLAGSLPLSLLGLGVMEGVALPLLTGPEAGASANAVVGALLVFRVYLIVYAVVGAWWVVRGRFTLHPPGGDAVQDDAASATPL